MRMSKLMNEPSTNQTCGFYYLGDVNLNSIQRLVLGDVNINNI